MAMAQMETETLHLLAHLASTDVKTKESGLVQSAINFSGGPRTERDCQPPRALGAQTRGITFKHLANKNGLHSKNKVVNGNLHFIIIFTFRRLPLFIFPKFPDI